MADGERNTGCSLATHKPPKQIPCARVCVCVYKSVVSGSELSVHCTAAHPAEAELQNDQPSL